MKKKAKQALCILCGLALIVSMSSGAIAAVDFVPEVVDLDAVKNGTQTDFFARFDAWPIFQEMQDRLDTVNVGLRDIDIETVRKYGVFVPASDGEVPSRAPSYCGN